MALFRIFYCFCLATLLAALYYSPQAKVVSSDFALLFIIELL